MSPNKITITDAQSQIDSMVIARLLTDFRINFKDEYPEHILTQGVGPVQSLIGFAIKNGYLQLPTNETNNVESNDMAVDEIKFTGRTRYRIHIERKWFKTKQYLVLQHEVTGFVPEFLGNSVGGEYRTYWIDTKPEWMMVEEYNE